MSKPTVIALDSNLFIYLLEDNPAFADDVQKLFDAAARGTYELSASEMVLFEVVSSKKLSATIVRQVIKDCNGLPVSYKPVDSDVLLRAAELRREAGLGALDSIHVASALVKGCTHFVTNDHELLEKRVKGIRLVAIGDMSKLI